VVFLDADARYALANRGHIEDGRHGATILPTGAAANYICLEPKLRSGMPLRREAVPAGVSLPALPTIPTGVQQRQPSGLPDDQGVRYTAPAGIVPAILI
jgi:hypothetical protein